MSLRTATSLVLDRLQYDRQILAVDVDLALLPGTNRAAVAIAAGVRFEAEPGSEASLTLDGGEGGETVLTGTVESVERSQRATWVSLIDAGSSLGNVRAHETWSGLLGAQIISKLADLAGVSTGLVVSTTQTASYVGDPRRTAAEHVARIAQLSNAFAAVDGAGRLTVAPWPIELPTAAMRADREFVSLATAKRRPSHEFAVVGASGAAIAAAPDAFLMSTEAVSSTNDPEPGRSWVADPLLRTTTDVKLANKGSESRRGAVTTTLDGTCWLQPVRRPGDVVQIQQGATDTAGPWMITGVEHSLQPGRAVTRLAGVSAGSSLDLLGSLGGLGGLL